MSGRWNGDALYAQLAWLPPVPLDFRERCRAAEIASDCGRALQRLVRYGLDENQLRKVAACVARVRATGRDLTPLTPFRLGIVGNATFDHVVPILIATALRHGIALECIKAEFGQSIQEALDPDSVINRAGLDAVLIALDYRGLPIKTDLRAGDRTSGSIGARDFVRSLRAGFRNHGGAPSIVQTVPPPPETVFGHLDRRADETLQSALCEFNVALRADLTQSEDVLLDVAALAETVGLANWHAPTQWNVAKFSFDAVYLPLYADHVCRIVAAMRGKSRKCLVLDLDNTLWGGVIGDDGVGGIVLGQGDPTGEAHLDVQRTALTLRERGIVLAVSSKNEDAVARSVFQQHPEMLIREEHIAVFQANWNDKASNLSAIAAELALGIDSLVFLDDNPVERDLVRELLPDVAVPELPEDPALYARTLAAAGYFESVAFSAEDRRRAEFYQGNARRVALERQVGDVDAFLAGLHMEIEFRPFDPTGRSRIAQLINKSNQFNLTTRRYTEAEIASLETDREAFTLQVRLVDSFGDNGMICVVICRAFGDDAWEIDTWLMSCRVLGRRVEQMVLRELLQHARGRGIRRLLGRYAPTPKNGMVKDHFAKLGFSHVEENTNGVTAWEIAADTQVDAAPMVVRRDGFALAIA